MIDWIKNLIKKKKFTLYTMDKKTTDKKIEQLEMEIEEMFEVLFDTRNTDD